MPAAFPMLGSPDVTYGWGPATEPASWFTTFTARGIERQARSAANSLGGAEMALSDSHNRRLAAEIADSFDEELEMELDDERLAKLLDGGEQADPNALDRQFYFKELFRLQSELVKLQDWVQHQKLKIVVVFEGRDAAGKGGVIKRITQRLNPRVCRVAALPAPSERERTQWYFQRYVAHLPAGGEIVQIGR